MAANITLTLASPFVDITKKGEYCTAYMNLAPNPTGRVKLVYDPTTGIARLKVKGGYADLSFQILAPGGAAGKFKALGICFDGPNGDLQGESSFDLSNIHLDGDTLRIRNNWGQLGSYKAYFWIQRNSDGAFGIIDPIIENEN